MSNTGLRTLEDLRGRCVIDEITNCWNYGGARTVRGEASIWCPVLKIRTTPGVVLCWFKTGTRPAPGVVWHRTCESLGCCNPAHRQAGTRKSQMAIAGLVRDPLVRARIARTKRESSKLSEDAVQEIRSSSDPLASCAARHGISLSHVSRIRRGEMRRPLGQGASVFNFGGFA